MVLASTGVKKAAQWRLFEYLLCFSQPKVSHNLNGSRVSSINVLLCHPLSKLNCFLFHNYLALYVVGLNSGNKKGHP